jgi:hypothetical protein
MIEYLAEQTVAADLCLPKMSSRTFRHVRTLIIETRDRPVTSNGL